MRPFPKTQTTITAPLDNNLPSLLSLNKNITSLIIAGCKPVPNQEKILDEVIDALTQLSYLTSIRLEKSVYEAFANADLLNILSLFVNNNITIYSDEITVAEFSKNNTKQSAASINFILNHNQENRNKETLKSTNKSNESTKQQSKTIVKTLGSDTTNYHILALPETIQCVVINSHTPFDILPTLITKPHINSVELGSNITDKHIEALPATINSVTIGSFTPIKVLATLIKKPNITLAQLILGTTSSHIGALPATIHNVTIGFYTPKNILPALANQQNITTVTLGLGITIDHIRELPTTIKSVVISSSTPVNVLSELKKKPNITSAQLALNTTNAHIHELPPTIEKIFVESKEMLYRIKPQLGDNRATLLHKTEEKTGDTRVLKMAKLEGTHNRNSNDTDIAEVLTNMQNTIFQKPNTTPKTASKLNDEENFLNYGFSTRPT